MKNPNVFMKISLGLVVVLVLILVVYLSRPSGGDTVINYEPINGNSEVVTTDEKEEVEIVSPKLWTLFLYSTSRPNSEYQTSRYDDFASKENCLIKGQSLVRAGGSYECAQGCKYNTDYATEICERTCDHNGCRE